MFNRILSSIGIGSSKVDLVLPRVEYRAGEKVEGCLKVEGGISDQVVQGIDMQLVVHSRYKDGDEVKEVSKVLDQAALTEGFTIRAGEQREIEVTYSLPENIPVTTDSTRIFLATGMDINLAVDPRDNDPITVLPGKRQQIVMTALEKELGFRRKRGTGAFNGRFQEFEYRPGRFLSGKLDELEVIYHVRDDGIGLVLQIDKKTGGLLAGLLDELDLDEKNVSCFIGNHQITSPAEVAGLLGGFIEQEYRKM